MAKKLLKESTIRRFQRLANVAPINEMYHKRDEDLMEEEDMEMDDAEMGAEDAEMGAEDAEMGDEEGMDGDLELTDEEAQSIIDLGAKLEAAMGGMDMGGEEEAPEMGEEEIMEALRGISYVPSRGEVVNEVAKRVARRLKEAKLHEAKLNRALGSRRR